MNELTPSTAAGAGGAADAGGTGPAADKQDKNRILTTNEFLKTVKGIGGFRGAFAFAERWIHGRGAPTFTLGYLYKPKTNA